jgi:hypothetical protein
LGRQIPARSATNSEEQRESRCSGVPKGERNARLDEIGGCRFDGNTAKAAKGAGRPFPKVQSGNPKRRERGSRNRATQAMQLLLDGEPEALIRKAVALALRPCQPYPRALLATASRV